MLTSAVLVLVMLSVVSDSSLGRSFRQAFSSLKLPRVTFGRVLLLLIVVGVVVMMMMWLKDDALPLIGPALPEALASLAMLDVATYLDVIALMAIVAVTVRFRAVRATVRNALVRGWQVLRTARARALGRLWRKRRPPSRGPDGEPGWAGWLSQRLPSPTRPAASW